MAPERDDQAVPQDRRSIGRRETDPDAEQRIGGDTDQLGKSTQQEDRK